MLHCFVSAQQGQGRLPFSASNAVGNDAILYRLADFLSDYTWPRGLCSSLSPKLFAFLGIRL